MAYEKLYNEIYAIAALKYLWRGYRPGFEKSESPDWLNRSASFGLEVSQALLPYDGQAERFLESYLGRPSSEIPPEERARYEGRLYFYNDRLWALESDPLDRRSYQEKVLFRFSRKLEKLNRNFAVCRTNALYLYAHALPESSAELEPVISAMAFAQQSQPNRFHLIFLDCDSSIFVLEPQRGKISEIPVAAKAGAFLAERTELARASGRYENDSEI